MVGIKVLVGRIAAESPRYWHSTPSAKQNLEERLEFQGDFYCHVETHWQV